MSTESSTSALRDGNEWESGTDEVNVNISALRNAQDASALQQANGYQLDPVLAPPVAPMPPEPYIVTVPVTMSTILSTNFERVNFPDPAGRAATRSLLVSRDGGRLLVEPVWIPEIAALIGRTCGRSLKGKHCRSDMCPYLHVCRAWDTRLVC